MPHAYPDAFKTHLQGECTTLALLWRITCRDGTVYRFTDHNADIIYNGDSYNAKNGFTPSSIEQSENMNIDTADLSGFFSDGAITEIDIRGGRFDDAAMEMFHVNYADTDAQIVLRAKGTLGDISIEGNRYKAEFRSLTQKLQQPVGRIITPDCDALLGDTRCGVNLTAYSFAGTVSTAGDRLSFTASGLGQANGYFKNGKITFTSGDNNGVAREVKSYNDGIIQFYLPVPKDIASGDAFTAIAGCDKSVGTCNLKFDNTDNFRGFPDVPGPDRAMRVYS